MDIFEIFEDLSCCALGALIVGIVVVLVICVVVAILVVGAASWV